MLGDQRRWTLCNSWRWWRPWNDREQSDQCTSRYSCRRPSTRSWPCQMASSRPSHVITNNHNYNCSKNLYLRTSRLDKDFGPLPPIACLFLPSAFLLLDVAPFQSLVYVCGTIYLKTLPPHRPCLHLKQRLKWLFRLSDGPTWSRLLTLQIVQTVCLLWSLK